MILWSIRAVTHSFNCSAHEKMIVFLGGRWVYQKAYIGKIVEWKNS